MESRSLSSSPDPISIIADSSPIRPRPATTPLKSRSSNIISPSKSVILDGQDVDGKSPWRLRVTVQAEPCGPEINRRVTRRQSKMSKTTTVPLKTADELSPVKRRGRPRKSIPGTADSADPRRGPTLTGRSPTPAAPRRSRSTAARGLGADSGNGSDHRDDARSPSPDINAEPLASAVPGISPSAASGSSSVEERRNRSSSPSPETIEDASLNEDDFPDGSYDYQSEHQSELHDQEPPPLVPGDATTIESEEFSMISVDSLSSRQPYLSSPKHPKFSDNPRIESSVSYMPSSPPLVFRPAETPMVQQTPSMPAAPFQSGIKFPHVMTPLRESAVRSGKVLQDIVRSPERNDPRPSPGVAPDGLFEGFSANTKRQLRQSLQLGANMARGSSSHRSYSSPSAQPSNSSGIKYPELGEARVDHRLPTPDDRDQGEEVPSHHEAVYPRLSPSLKEPVSIVSARSYDAMSWIPTGPSRTATPAVTKPVMSDKIYDSAQRGSKIVIEVPSDSSSDGEVEDETDEEDEPQHQSFDQRVEQRDVWQEEASRTENDGCDPAEVHDEVSALFEGPVAPRRSKIPGTWRRTSGSYFQYSDSPEPESIPHRATSSEESSRKSSGVATPPATDDEEESAHDSLQEDKESEAQLTPNEEEVGKKHHDDLDEEAEVTSPFSEGGSPDGEDTGMFWQSNLPNIFHRRQRSSNHQPELSVMSDLKPISSPTTLEGNSIAKVPGPVGRSPMRMRPVQGSIHMGQPSSSILSSPLRKSLLKSSKLDEGSSANVVPAVRHSVTKAQIGTAQSQSQTMVNQDVSSGPLNNAGDKHSDDEDGEEASVTSDTRQLLAEMASHNRRQSFCLPNQQSAETSQENSQTEYEQSTFNTTDLKANRSYQEVLNLSSPTKIKVKFNDSSVLSNSFLGGRGSRVASDLSPKKVYHSLFDEDAPLGGTSLPSQVSIEHTSGQMSEHPHAGTLSASRSPKTGLLSQMTSGFWSAVTSKAPATPKDPIAMAEASAPASDGPTTKQALAPELQVASTEEESSLSSARPSSPPTTVSPALEVPAKVPVSRESTTVPSAPLRSDTTLRLRRKYGLLSPDHPFTLQHVRTLHRLHTSTFQHPSTTIVPLAAPLPAELQSFIGQEYISPQTGKTHIWAAAELHAVAAFVELLVPQSEKKRLERMGTWGDEGAVKCAGWDSRGRHGSWFAFAGEGGDDKRARAMRGRIEAEWVVGVLGEVICKEMVRAEERRVRA